MQNHPIPSTKSTAAYKPIVRLTTHRGWYRVQSGTRADVWYETSANSCTCQSRRPCKHMRYVRALNVAFYVPRAAAQHDENPDAAADAASEALHDADRAETAMPLAPAYRATLERMARGDTDASTDTEHRLARALRALADTDVQSDERAVLMRRVDELERQVAAANYSAMRVA